MHTEQIPLLSSPRGLVSASFIWIALKKGYTVRYHPKYWQWQRANLKITGLIFSAGLPWWLKHLRIHQQCRRPGFNPWVGKFPWRRDWLPTPIFLPGEFHGQRSLVGYSPWCCKESDTAERLTLWTYITILLIIFWLFCDSFILFLLLLSNIVWISRNIITNRKQLKIYVNTVFNSLTCVHVVPENDCTICGNNFYQPISIFPIFSEQYSA